MAKTASSLTVTTSSRLAAARRSAPQLSGASCPMPRKRGLTHRASPRRRYKTTVCQNFSSGKCPYGRRCKCQATVACALTSHLRCKTSQVQLHPQQRAADAALRPLCSVPSKLSAAAQPSAAQPSAAQPSAARTSVARGAPSLLVLLPIDADRAPDRRPSPADAAEPCAEPDAADEPRRAAFHA